MNFHRVQNTQLPFSNHPFSWNCAPESLASSSLLKSRGRRRNEVKLNKNYLVQMLGQMYPRQKYVPAPLYFGKVYFPEINSRVERKERGNCVRDGDEAQDSSRAVI